MRNGSKPVMRFGSIDIFQLRDLPENRKIVRLTKWLPAVEKELQFLEKEYQRITSDPTRIGIIVYHNGQVALYVNDLTGGVFDRLSEDEDS